MKTTRPALPELETQLNAAAQAAARKYGREAAPLIRYENQDPYHIRGGFKTTCYRTAAYAAAWLNARSYGTQDAGKHMVVHVYGITGDYQVRLYEYSIGE